MPSRLPRGGGKSSGFSTSCGVRNYLDKFLQTSRTVMPVIWAIRGWHCSVRFCSSLCLRKDGFQMDNRHQWAMALHIVHVLFLCPASCTFFPRLFGHSYWPCLSLISLVLKIPHSWFTTWPWRHINEAIAGTCCIFGTIFHARVWLPSELMKNSGFPWKALASVLSSLQGSTSDPVFSKGEIIIEKRKSIELGEFSASGHHALSYEREMLAFAHPKGLWQS